MSHGGWRQLDAQNMPSCWQHLCKPAPLQSSHAPTHAATKVALTSAAGAPPCVTLRLAPPLAAVSQPLTLAANLRLHRLSCAEAGSGLMLQNISVLPWPPRQGCAQSRSRTAGSQHVSGGHSTRLRSSDAVCGDSGSCTGVWVSSQEPALHKHATAPAWQHVNHVFRSRMRCAALRRTCSR